MACSRAVGRAGQRHFASGRRFLAVPAHSSSRGEHAGGTAGGTCKDGKRGNMLEELLARAGSSTSAREVSAAELGALARTLNHSLNVREYTELMSALTRRNAAREALDLYGELLARQELQPDAQSLCAAISACGRAREWERALQLHMDLRLLGTGVGSQSDTCLSSSAPQPPSAPAPRPRPGSLRSVSLTPLASMLTS
ncbi:unnamed protein product [Polarella glacialis]|uniref:Uncharacterized protein n=1 Tax=Polarella glacialis TaxID=89957 RepID=A0A813IZW8_POLGL|nr:unnamed protein product [Polarella glacialis]